MSFWSALLKVLGGSKPSLRPTSTPPVPTSLTFGITIRSTDGKVVDGATGALVIYGPPAEGLSATGFHQVFTFPWRWRGTGARLTVTAEGFTTRTVAGVLPVGPERRFVLDEDREAKEVILEPVPTDVARAGLVRLERRIFVDDTGPFHPLGITFFWALGGWKRDRARVLQHLDYLRHRVDYIRILGQVGWSGEDIDPTWPEYSAWLGELIDAAYERGLRTQLTVIGTAGGDPVGAARKMRGVINDGRRHKVLMLEGVNEGNIDSDASAVAVTRALGACGVPFGVGLGDQGLERIDRLSADAGATVGYFHTERDPAEAGARQVRQAWDFHRFKLAGVNNEPPGPGSSVAELSDPFKLATFRALSIICGAGAFCFHVGSMVFGRTFVTASGIQRYANLWDVPNIDAMLTAVRAADARLPADVQNWAKFNDGWTPPNPTAPISCVGPANKHYGARDYGSRRFASMPIGCTGPITLTAREPVTVDVSNPATGAIVLTRDLAVGETQTLSGLWAYLLVGQVQA